MQLFKRTLFIVLIAVFSTTGAVLYFFSGEKEIKITQNALPLEANLSDATSIKKAKEGPSLLGLEEGRTLLGPEVTLGQKSAQQTLGNEEKPKQTIQVWLAAGETRVSLDVPEGSTAYDLMKIAQAKGLISFDGREFAGLGFFVEEINGARQDFTKNMTWIYYLNGDKAKVGISNTIIKQNDIIEWKYERME